MASDLISSRRCIYWEDPLLFALDMLAGVKKRSPYRLAIVDRKLKVKGVITGRRILEILLGRRGAALRNRRGVTGLLREKVGLFCDEAHNIFHERTPAHILGRYMAENHIGTVFVIDENSVFKGVVEEASFLERLRGRLFNIKIGDIMHKEVYTVNPETNLIDAANLMIQLRVRRLPVVIGKKVVGIITITDILHHILEEEKHITVMLENVEVAEILKEQVGDVMQTRVVKINPESDVGTAIDQILEKDVSSLIITSKGDRLEGIACRIDIISGLVKVAGIQL